MDIRFIDSRYKELFRIPDGGCIKINLNNGGTLLGKCKYIDDYHFTLTQVGRMYGETYHIRQFAEINERNGNSEENIKEAAQSKQPRDFFDRLSENGRCYLIDAGAPEFRGNLESFINRKADFEGCTKKTMDGLKKAIGIEPKHKDMER
jgi:hypothetical protein